MPYRVGTLRSDWDFNARLSHQIEQTNHFSAALSFMRQKYRRTRQVAWRSLNLRLASETKLIDIWNRLQEFRSNTDVAINDVITLLWSSFEADVRYLVDHVAEGNEEPVDPAMTHAVANAAICMNAIFMILADREDPVIDVNEYHKIVEQFSRRHKDYRDDFDIEVLIPPAALVPFKF